MFWLSATLTTVAQQSLIKKMEISFSVGVADYYISRQRSLETLDLLNYANSDPGPADYILASIGGKLEFTSGVFSGFRLIMMDDMVPDNFYFSFGKRFSPHWGISAGTMLSKFYITGFEEYEIRKYKGYLLTDENVRQMKMFDYSLFVSPFFVPFDNGKVNVLLKLDAGLSRFLKHMERFLLKKEFSNERIMHVYQFRNPINAFLQPGVKLSFNILKYNGITARFFIDANYYFSKREIGYRLQTYQWTYGKSEPVKVSLPTHSFSRTSMDAGLVLSF